MINDSPPGKFASTSFASNATSFVNAALLPIAPPGRHHDRRIKINPPQACRKCPYYAITNIHGARILYLA